MSYHLLIGECSEILVLYIDTSLSQYQRCIGRPREQLLMWHSTFAVGVGHGRDCQLASNQLSPQICIEGLLPRSRFTHGQNIACSRVEAEKVKPNPWKRSDVDR